MKEEIGILTPLRTKRQKISLKTCANAIERDRAVFYHVFNRGSVGRIQPEVHVLRGKSVPTDFTQTVSDIELSRSALQNFKIALNKKGRT